MDKEKFLEWLKEKERSPQTISSGKIREEIEKGTFDKEVTPCENATHADTD